MPVTPSQRGGPIIWPLRGKLLQAVFIQQHPAWAGGLSVPSAKYSLPWSTVGHPSLGDIASRQPTVVHQLLPKPPTYFRITGTTRDSSGQPLANCVVDWFDSATDMKLDSVTSDADGLFEFRTAGQPPNAYYLVAYKSGETDVAGTTVNTLVGL